MQPVQAFEAGELYIGGAGVARGYVNRSDLTTAQFLQIPPGKGPRLYRTGDLVRQTADGALQFLGRIDNQVKIRGFRIELPEIEAVLQQHPRVRTTAVKVVEDQGLQRIAAYVVADGPTANFDRDDVLELLHTRLPDYMIPEYLDLVDALPILPSGKVDRASLPAPGSPLVRTRRTIIQPRTDMERQITGVWEQVLGISPVSVEDDFFLDLGGHSLLAAQMVSLLREMPGLTRVDFQDIYRYRTIARLANHVVSSERIAVHEGTKEPDSPVRQSSRAVFESLSRFNRWTCIVLQAFSVYLIYGVAAAPAVALFLLWGALREGGLSPQAVIGFGLALVLGFYPAMLALSIIVKWLVIGRYKPGSYPVWGLYYFRWWLVTRIQSLSRAGFLTGTPLMAVYYRLMGAKVGRNCTLDTELCRIFDLVSIGEDTCIGAETQLLGYRVEDGMLLIGRFDIGRRCFVGIHSALGLDTRMGDDARLDDLSLLADGEAIAAGESRRGSPSQSGMVAVPAVPAAPAVRRRPLLFGLFHLFLIYTVEIILILAALPPVVLILFAFHGGGLIRGMAAVVLAAPLGVISLCLSVALVKALVLWRVEPGVYPVESSFYLRKWFIDRLLLISRSLLLPLYATLYLPPWLRLLGAQIGARVEVSTVSHISPDLLVAKDESFFADAAIIGGMRIFLGYAEIGQNRIGHRSFVGNSAMLPVGTDLGDGCLIGSLSAPPGGVVSTPDGSAWLGSPAFHLPRRQQLAGFDETVLYRPSTSLYVQRLVFDALRILIPGVIVTGAFAGFFLILSIAYQYLALSSMLVLAPLLGFSISVGAALCVVAVKKLLIGKYQPTEKPLWSLFVWLNEIINGAYEFIAAPALSPLQGTPYFTPYLRLLGCRIGRHVYTETTLFSEFDLVEIGDYAALNLGATIQTHLFEDRIMKASHLRIGDECSVGNMSVVLYDTEMLAGSSIGALSLLMKGETVPAFSRWHGITAGIKGAGDR